MDVWVEKYRPVRLKDIAGNYAAVKKLMDWIGGWKKGRPKKKAVLLHGPPGCGKTSAAYALAGELGYDPIEFNASDSRTQKVIDRLVGQAATLGTLDPEKEHKLIILDEVDGIHGTKDRGGMRALRQQIRNTRQPMILIANDAYKLDRSFRNLTDMIQFKKVDKRTIARILKEISVKEGIKAREKAIEIIATNAGGDMRAAINDLQGLTLGKTELEVKDALSVRMRDTEVKIFDTLARIFKGTSVDRAREATWDAKEDPDTLLKWIVENVPREYEKPRELALAYHYLSRADVFLGRIMRRQDWSLLSYASDLMSAGVAVSKDKKYNKFERYRPPEIFGIYARSRKKRAEADSIAAKLSDKCHGSKKLAREYYFPLIEAVSGNLEMAASITSEFNLTDVEVGFFAKEDETLMKRIMQRSEEITRERIRAQTVGDSAKQASLFEF